MTDRRGHQTIHVFNEKNELIRRQDGEGVWSFYHYDNDGNVVSAQTGGSDCIATGVGCSESHIETYIYDTMGNQVEKRVRPDTIRPSSGGKAIVTRYVYEPIYNQLRTTIDPRAFDLDATAQVWTQGAGQQGGEAWEPVQTDLVKRFSVTRTFDYQEGGHTGTPLQAYINRWNLNEAVAHSTIFGQNDADGTGIGDANGDGTTTTRAGGVVREMHGNPLWGSLTDILETRFSLNNRGQPLKTETIMGGTNASRVTTYEYGTTPGTYDYGYLTVQKSAVAADGSSPPNYTWVTTKYTHDRLGNVATETDGRGVVTTYSVNSSNQIYRVKRADAIASGYPETGLTAFHYQGVTEYDGNSNAKRMRVQKNTTGTLAFADINYTFDILDHKLSESIAVQSDIDSTVATRTTTYIYDHGGLLSRTVLPVGNVIENTYDGVDRLIKVKRYAIRVANPQDSPTANGGDAETDTTYDGQGNVKTVIDPNGLATTYAYDAYDRKILTTQELDQDGNGTVDSTVTEKITYNPAGLVIRLLKNSIVQ